VNRNELPGLVLHRSLEEPRSGRGEKPSHHAGRIKFDKARKVEESRQCKIVLVRLKACMHAALSTLSDHDRQMDQTIGA
jgi:hypothetical protein